MNRYPGLVIGFTLIAVLTFGCGFSTGTRTFQITEAPMANKDTPLPGKEIAATLTPLPTAPVKIGPNNPDEPVFISGDIPYTSPFFLNTISQPFVLLEDQAGFVRRDREFTFSLSSQVLGPVEILPDKKLTYSLALPAVPQGTMLDLDNNSEENLGVQVFAVAYWSNTWGDPFLEERDGSGWSTAYASTISDPEKDDEIVGGTLIVWSPDDEQGFPSGFGPDGKLFTADDPIQPIPPGYSLVNLDQEPFQIYKEAQPQISLNEGVIAVNDYSNMDYLEAFTTMFDKVIREYPFTQDKNIDWEALRAEFTPKFARVNSDNEFYRLLRDLTYRIPDGHANISFNNQVFYQERGGGLGLVLVELSDGRVIVRKSLPDLPASKAGIQVGAEILTWNGQAVAEAISSVVPYFGPYSTEHARRIGQVNFLTRLPPDTQVEIGFKNPGGAQTRQVSLKAIPEFDSLFETLPGYDNDKLALPIQAYVLKEENVGVIQVNTFSDDYQLMARLWEYYIEKLIDEDIPALIIDLRSNSGGSLGMALDFAGYFFRNEIPLYEMRYYSEASGAFEKNEYPVRIKPAPTEYTGKIAVLVSANCVSACEGFAWALTQEKRAAIIGHTPTAGAFGEVGQGQYSLPGNITMQFPTGRPESLDGNLLIEGVGVIPNIQAPITEESALGNTDALLQEAIQYLLR